MESANALNVPVTQFGPKGVAIDAQEVSSAELIDIGGSQACTQKRRLNLSQHALVEAARRKVLAE